MGVSYFHFVDDFLCNFYYPAEKFFESYKNFQKNCRIIITFHKNYHPQGIWHVFPVISHKTFFT